MTTQLCAFCEYISGRVLWFPVWEHRSGVVFLNLRQRSEGALLVAPRRHVTKLTDLTKDEFLEILVLTRKASVLVMRTYAPDALHTWCNLGEASGQSEAHAHFQVVPRYASRPYTFEGSGNLSNTPNAVLHSTLEKFNAQKSSVDAETLQARPKTMASCCRI
jgi:histidine triad (HIT) family protein